MPFKLAPLSYDYAALEPHIDAETMKLHHDKHHQTYIDNVNKALAEYPQLDALPVDQLLGKLAEVPEQIRTLVRNNAGGHANHAMFWTIMQPAGGGEPTGAVAEQIKKDFGGFDQLKAKFNEAGTKQFGSGWVFLVANAEGALEISAKPNQDSPLLEHKQAILGNDVWEHAYYLKYQNKRADYLAAWWNTVSWEAVTKRYEAIKAGHPAD